MNRLTIGASDKTDLLLHFLQNDFPNGLTLIDPDGRLARALLDIIPERYTEDTFYFDPSDADNIGSFNVFENVKDKAKLVQDLCAFFDALFQGGSETLTRLNSTFVLANVLTILLDTQTPSFSSVLEFLSDTKFAHQCVKRSKNAIAVANWEAIEDWDNTQRKQAFANVQTKIGTLLLSPVMHRTLEGSSTFYLGQNKILIADLSRAKIGDTAAKLLGTLLITQATTPVYINDFGFYASDYLASLFSQGGYTVALQFLDELPRSVRQTVLGFDEKYIFRTTPEDADKLKYFANTLEIRNIVDLNPGDFLPPLDLTPPQVRGRSQAVLKRSIARNTRKRDTRG
jgi:hypothetical protein